MSVKRTHDPLGILPDGITVDAGDGNDAENATAWREYLHSISVAGRVERCCQRHPGLIPAADGLRAQALALGAESRKDWMTWPWRAAYEQLLGEAARLDVQKLAPDTLRGRKVKRGAHDGHVAVYGDAARQAQHDAQLRTAYLSVRPSKQFKADALRAAAKRCKVNTRTVRRAFERAKLPIL